MKNGRMKSLPRGMVLGAAITAGRVVKKNKEKIKKKISDIGNMKVKDAAKAIGSATVALSPAGLGKRIGQRLGTIGKGKKPKTGRDPEKRKQRPKGQERRFRMPSPEDLRKLFPRPDAKLLLTGGQAKLDRNKNNKIDAEDFKILRAEKAKGRGMGLQDEKMKPGTMMRARRGTIIKPKKPVY